MFAELLEAVMMICFGASWPMQIIKTVRVKNPTGKSFTFMTLILVGYLAGVAGKLCLGNFSPVLWLYILNTLMVGTDLTLSLIYLNRIRHQKEGTK